MLEQVLPVGTVVLLTGETKRLMILGYQQRTVKEPDRVYDYIGCTYPEGFLGVEEMLAFNHSDIAHIFALGLQNEEQIAFRAELEQQLDKQNLRK